MLVFKRASLDHLPQLVEVAVSAFKENQKHTPEHIRDGSPPGHDELAKHREWLEQYDYWICEENKTIIASCSVERLDDSCAWIHSMQVGQKHMGQGVGSWVLSQLEKQYPMVKRWSLETPDYAIRNHHFYKKNGYEITNAMVAKEGVDFEFYIFSKSID